MELLSNGIDVRIVAMRVVRRVKRAISYISIELTGTEDMEESGSVIELWR